MLIFLYFFQTGPKDINQHTQGVNYRALGDLFLLAQQRKDTFRYDVSVQMIEIYNEQVRDLLVTDGLNKRYPFNYYNLAPSKFSFVFLIVLHSKLFSFIYLKYSLMIITLEIRHSSQSGLSVPDASLVHVSSTADVIDLMNLGQRNRAVGATALNDRSSRSHR